MADPRFFANAGPFTLERLAALAEADVVRTGDRSDARFRDVAPLESAGPEDVSFLDNPRYASDFAVSRAGACIVRARSVDQAPAGMALLVSENPYLAYARVAQAFYPRSQPQPEIAPGAHVAPSASIAGGCRIDPGAVVGAGATLGEGCHIGANAVVGDNVVVGEQSVVEAGASLSHCLIGARVIIHMGARIGQDGFGFATGAHGHLKVPQLGRVIVEDDVEIGANTTIDRGAGPDTVIGAGSQIDNLVQIGHNVVLGRGCVVVAQVGISGSTKVGDYVMMGGQAGLTGHLSVGNKARIAAQSGVMRDVGEGETVGGSPACDMREWLRGVAVINRLARAKEGEGNG